MTDNEQDCLDMSWEAIRAAMGGGDSFVIKVHAVCPACGGLSGIGKIRMKEEPSEHITLESLSDEEFHCMVQGDMFANNNLCFGCAAYLEVDPATRAVSLEPSLTILSWIDEGRVPISAALGVWPTRWSRNSDPSFLLESLHLTEDQRLDTLLSRLETRGQKRVRIGRETWERPWPHREPKESFEDSLAAVCPSPPPIELVVAAVERARKGTR